MVKMNVCPLTGKRVETTVVADGYGTYQYYCRHHFELSGKINWVCPITGKRITKKSKIRGTNLSCKFLGR